MKVKKTKQQKGTSWIKKVEELRRHLQIVPNDEDDVYIKATPLALKVTVVYYEIYNEHNKPYYKIKIADCSHQLYLSFLSMLRNFDREDLEALWRLVKGRFATIKPKNFSDDFLLTTLGAMFKKPDVQAQIWKNQRSVHGQAKVKSWKLLKSCGVQIITFTTTQLILLVERKYLLTRFTLNQMLNNIRLEVKEESEEIKRHVVAKSKGKIPMGHALATFGMTLEEKKRKRTQFLKEAFITEDIRVDGMNKNMIPSPGVLPIKGLIIKEPESRIFYMNMNTDIVFQREKLEIHDHSNEPCSSKLVLKVVPPADKTTTS
nr:hypothetical protein [Tanacetum cinerariifolium]